jgi:hypothetical protein
VQWRIQELFSAGEGVTAGIFFGEGFNKFSDSFQKLYESCQQCVVKDGDHFEGQ